MRRIVNNPGSAKQDEDETTKMVTRPEPPSSDINLYELRDNAKLVIHRQMKNLLMESASGLLSKESDQALANCIKHIKDLLKEEETAVSGLSDEELEKLVTNGKTSIK